jgi:TfoX/Sxy family transcriptional regulator of competence genes
MTAGKRAKAPSQTALANLAAHLADVLAALGAVQTKRFFGGTALSLDGVQFGFVMKGALYLRVDDTSRAHFICHDSLPFRYVGAGGRLVEVASYYSAPPEILDDSDELARWARRALEAARGAPPAHPRRRGAP